MQVPWWPQPKATLDPKQTLVSEKQSVRPVGIYFFDSTSKVMTKSKAMCVPFKSRFKNIYKIGMLTIFADIVGCPG